MVNNINSTIAPTAPYEEEVTRTAPYEEVTPTAPMGNPEEEKLASGDLSSVRERCLQRFTSDIQRKKSQVEDLEKRVTEWNKNPQYLSDLKRNRIAWIVGAVAVGILLSAGFLALAALAVSTFSLGIISLGIGTLFISVPTLTMVVTTIWASDNAVKDLNKQIAEAERLPKQVEVLKKEIEAAEDLKKELKNLETLAPEFSADEFAKKLNKVETVHNNYQKYLGKSLDVARIDYGLRNGFQWILTNTRQLMSYAKPKELQTDYRPIGVQTWTYSELQALQRV